MVGWSRRHRESAKRRAAWWASLSEEEKEAALIQERKDDEKAPLYLFTALGVLGFFVVASSWGLKDKKPAVPGEPHRLGGFTDTGKGPVVFPAMARSSPDACSHACENLRVMFICTEGGDYLNHFEPCISDCRAGKVPWNVECAGKARTFEDVHACGIKCSPHAKGP